MGGNGGGLNETELKDDEVICGVTVRHGSMGSKNNKQTNQKKCMFLLKMSLFCFCFVFT